MGARKQLTDIEKIKDVLFHFLDTTLLSLIKNEIHFNIPVGEKLMDFYFGEPHLKEDFLASQKLLQQKKQSQIEKQMEKQKKETEEQLQRTVEDPNSRLISNIKQEKPVEKKEEIQILPFEEKQLEKEFHNIEEKVTGNIEEKIKENIEEKVMGKIGDKTIGKTEEEIMRHELNVEQIPEKKKVISFDD